ncbi:MAG TPA: TspO/MBR family protein [Kofleriaceae bacterium]|nr:TspO/MBR family protein [Kofleriaceae bacterium]
MLKRFAQWLGFVVLCNGVGAASALVANEPAYYQQLARPAWAPPPSVFGPVWTLLYTLMGTATWLVWTRTAGTVRRRAMAVFAVQLAFNALWTPVFFGLHALGVSVAVILGVLALVVAMTWIYARASKLAASLVVPLAAWVAFASALNIVIAMKN